MPDQRRVYTLDPQLTTDEIGQMLRQLSEAYLMSRASGVRRTIAYMERLAQLRL